MLKALVRNNLMNKFLNNSIERYKNDLAMFQKNKAAYIEYAKKLANSEVEDVGKFVGLKMRKDGINWSGFDEPLCERYANYRLLTVCWKCPVKRDGHKHCRNTPWEFIDSTIRKYNGRAEEWISLIECAFINEINYLKKL